MPPLPAGDTTASPLGPIDPETTRDSTESQSKSDDLPLVPGDKLDDYQIIDFLGRGGMGVVYRALQVGAGRIVALKVIRGDRLSDREALRRFESEARAAARVEHDNLVTVYDVGRAEGMHFYSMRLVTGESLAQIVAKEPLECLRAARYIEQAARAVHAAHELGILHRDIKPNNILIDAKKDKALVADFGLAKLQETGHELTQSGQVFGTPSYFAPEQARDAAAVTAAADVYSLGATLFHLVSGRPPFQAKSLPDLLRQVSETEAPRLRKMSRSADRDLETICSKCLEKDPKRRYASAMALANDLSRYLANEPITARPAGMLERAYRWTKRKPITAGLIAASLATVLLAGVAGVLAKRNIDAQRETAIVRTWNELDVELRDKLQKGSLEPGYLRGVDDIFSRMQQIDSLKTTEAQATFRKTHAAFLRQQIEQPRLRDADFSALTASLEAFRPYDEEQATALSARLAGRKREWRDVLMLAAPFAELHDAFVPEVARVDPAKAGQLLGVRSTLTVASQKTNRSGPKTPPPLLCPTKLGSVPNADIEVAFTEDWEQGSMVGICVGYEIVEAGRPLQAYEFVLVSNPSSPYALRPGNSFAQSRRETLQPFLRIERAGVILEQFSIPWTALPSGPLTLRARRDGAKLSVQVNGETPLVVEELLPQSFVAEGQIALYWPEPAGLVSLRIAAPLVRPLASPLEAADALLGEAKYAEALEAFQSLDTSGASSLLAQEVLFKRAACLVQLKRFAEAEPILTQLMLNKDGPWPVRASLLAWQQHLDAKHEAKAAELADFVQLRYPPDRIAAAAPFYQRSDITNKITSGREWDLSDIDRDVKSLLALAPTPAELFWTHYRLALELADAERFDEAIKYCKLVEQDPRICLEWSIKAVEEHARILNIQGHPEAGLALLNDCVSRSPYKDDDLHREFYVYRAALLANQGKCEEAGLELDVFFDHGGVASDDCFMHGHLLRGFVAEKLGHPEAALKAWKDGFRYLKWWNKNISKSVLATPYTPMLGSLSEEFTDQDIDQAVVALGVDGTSLAFFKNFMPKSFLYDGPKTAWRTPRGKYLAEQTALLRAIRLQVTMFTAEAPLTEAWRMTILGTADLSVQFSDDQRNVVGKLVQDELDLLRRGGANETDGFLMMATINGQSGVLGWQSLKPRLPKSLLPATEYLLGCLYRNQKKFAESRTFFQNALAAAAADSPLKRVVEQELAALETLEKQGGK